MDILLLAFVIFSLLFSVTTAAAIVLVDRRMERRDTHITLRRQGVAPADAMGASSIENVPAVGGHPGNLNPNAESGARGRPVYQANLATT